MSFWSFLVKTDEEVNDDILAGKEGETISSSVYRHAIKGKRFYIIAEAFINLLFSFFGQRYHCEENHQPQFDD